jgi:hypothetical protein
MNHKEFFIVCALAILGVVVYGYLQDYVITLVKYLGGML